MDDVDRLGRIIESCRKQPLSALSREDLRSLPILYRRLMAQIAEARAAGASKAQIAQLEALAVSGHAILYAPAPTHLGRALVNLLAMFPHAVRQARRYLGAAALLLVVGCLWGYLEVRRDSASAAVLLPQALQENAEESFQESARTRDGAPIYGVFYFTNNARVALQAFALGATLGVGTAIVLLTNGVLLGASFALVRLVASPRAFFSFVLPHGGLELGAILIAAAGGLMLGDALLRPGWRTRWASFRRASREALPLAIGAATLLAVAGLIEGWLSPKPWPLVYKAVLGLAVDALFIAYLLGVRSRGPLTRPSELTKTG